MAEETRKEPQAIYTEEDMSVREDLLEKLMTLEHVKSILVVREESQIYLNQIVNLQRIVQGWYNNAVNAKLPQKPAPAPAEKPPDEEPGE